MTEKRFYTDGQYVMQDREVYVICNGEHNADVVATALNELLTENKQLKKENEELKEFVRKISTNGRVVLANGNVYKIDKVIK